MRPLVTALWEEASAWIYSDLPAVSAGWLGRQEPWRSAFEIAGGARLADQLGNRPPR